MANFSRVQGQDSFTTDIQDLQHIILPMNIPSGAPSAYLSGEWQVFQQLNSNIRRLLLTEFVVGFVF